MKKSVWERKVRIENWKVYTFFFAVFFLILLVSYNSFGISVNSKISEESLINYENQLSPEVNSNHPKTSAVIPSTDRTDGVFIRWNIPTGAVNYAVYRCMTSSLDSCEGIPRPASRDGGDTSYLDTAATVGVIYWYAIDSQFSDGKWSGLTISTTSGKRISTINIEHPKTNAVILTGRADGIMVTWNIPTGAVNYAVYRCMTSSLDSCEGIPRPASKSGQDTSYLDTGAKEGLPYWYAIDSQFSDSQWSGLTISESYAVKGNIVSHPKTNAVILTGRADGIMVTWNNPEGAVNYAVYRCTSSNIGSCIGIPKPASRDGFDTSYLDTAAIVGVIYWYAIDSQFSDGKWSGKEISKASGKRTETSSGETKVSVSISPYGGAASGIYEVYWSTSGDSVSACSLEAIPNGKINVDFNGKLYLQPNTLPWTVTVSCLNSEGQLFSGSDTVYPPNKVTSTPSPTNCGEANQPVCADGSCKIGRYSNQNGICKECGKEGQIKCDSYPECNAQRTPVNGICTNCGDNGESCCWKETGSKCVVGLKCSSSVKYEGICQKQSTKKNTCFLFWCF